MNTIRKLECFQQALRIIEHGVQSMESELETFVDDYQKASISVSNHCHAMVANLINFDLINPKAFNYNYVLLEGFYRKKLRNEESFMGYVEVEFRGNGWGVKGNFVEFLLREVNQRFFPNHCTK